MSPDLPEQTDSSNYADIYIEVTANGYDKETYRSRRGRSKIKSNRLPNNILNSAKLIVYMLKICKRQLASIIDESISHLEEVYASMQPWYQDSMSNSRELQHLRSISDARMSGRKHRRDKSEISCCLKYLIFGFNVIFWLLGLCIFIVGIWAWTEKDIFNNLSRLTNITLDPAFVFIVCGVITFTIGFTGCVGALRENTCLLASYAIFLAILLLLEMTAGTLGFIFKDWIKNQATNGFQAFIVHYREDPDRQNLIDWIQEQWLECCGIEGPKDWDMNVYFNCSSIDVGSREACGVPFSCCKPQPNEVIKNKQCGYDVRKQDYTGDKSTVIYEKGCLRAGEEWIEANLVPVAGVSVGVAVLQERDRSRVIFEKGCLQSGEEWAEKNLLPLAGVVLAVAFAQILGICFAQNLRADIFAQKAKWH